MNRFTSEEERLLKLFQSETNRRAEEEFARIFTENDNVRVAFINENRAFTDGRNIVVDPAEDKLFSDYDAIESTLEFLGLPAGSCSQWDALKLTTRSQDIHECLHIIFTQFPLPSIRDPRSTTKARMITLSLIANILEDAYIEAVGASLYDNVEMLLKWGRASRMFVSRPSEGTISQSFAEAEIGETDADKLMYILNYMATELLYPMIRLPVIKDGCTEYIDKIKPMYINGSVASSPKKRHEYACMIFDELEELIPESEEYIDSRYLDSILGGTETHSPTRCSAKQYASKGKEMSVNRRLFTKFDNTPVNNDNDNLGRYSSFIYDSQSEYKAALAELESKGETVFIYGGEYDAAPMHSEIRIKEYHPKPDTNMSKAYSNIVKKYSAVINTYRARFELLLKSDREHYEGGQLFGNGISSKNLGDTKKRYWYRKSIDPDVPDLAVLFMIDGSGSMTGERKSAAITSSVILHEVLSKQGIEHAIVEHRAIFDEPLLEHNVLVSFNGSNAEKCNIMKIDARQGTREGLSLFWAERFLLRNSMAEKKLIVVISDGEPVHEYDGIPYAPPVSVMDTHNAARKIIRRGTKIIALALGGRNGSCYDALSRIYPETIDCTELKSLTGQLLKVISRELK